MPQHSLYIKVEGQALSAQQWDDILEIVVEDDLQQPAMFTLRIHDPQLTWTDGSLLNLGKAIEIGAVGANNQHTALFKGEVTSLEPEWSAHQSSLTVRGYDRAHRLYRQVKLRTFTQKTDSQIAQQIAQENGLQADVVASTIQHEYVIQHNLSDLEFLRQRAERIGYRVRVIDRKLSFKPAEQAPVEAIEQTWGKTLLEFSARLSAVSQPNSVEIRSWNPKDKAVVVGSASSPTTTHSLGESRSGGTLAQTAFGTQAKVSLSDLSVRTQAEATKRAQALLDQHASQTIYADGICLGAASLQPGVLVPIKGIGTKFSGKYFVSATRHEYTPEQGYMTLFVVNGHQPYSLAASQSNHTQTGIPGVAVGVVTNLNDPDNLGRVKVRFPWCSEEHESDWAWVASLGAGNQRGFHMSPEVNDQVLVAFEAGQLQRPFVIGGLWNTKDALPGSSTQEGTVKTRALKLRSGHAIEFIEDEGANKGAIVIKTSSGRAIAIHDTDKKIEVKSVNHSITLDDQANAVAIEAQNKLELKCGPNTLTFSPAGIELNGAGGKLVIASAGIELAANANLTLKANAMAELACNAIMNIKTSAIMNIQGTLVKIN